MCCWSLICHSHVPPSSLCIHLYCKACGEIRYYFNMYRFIRCHGGRPQQDVIRHYAVISNTARAVSRAYVGRLNIYYGHPWVEFWSTTTMKVLTLPGLELLHIKTNRMNFFLTLFGVSFLWITSGVVFFTLNKLNTDHSCDILKIQFPIILNLVKKCCNFFTSKIVKSKCIRQWSVITGFNPGSRHTKDFKNGTWYLLA